jgi:serine/threonine protein kinase
MSASREHHPRPSQLRAFAQGLLQGDEFAAVEEHVASCDSCCDQLAQTPDSTLIALARDAATRGFRENEPSAGKAADDIPAELENHPRYHVLKRIGAGGMGDVYQAEHRIMQRVVALKVVQPRLLSNPQAVERFRREVQLAGRLSHPNIVAAHDADEAGELHFLVMEYVDGVSLDERIAETGPATPGQACEWIRQAALGLQHAHEQGMAHRDIKPHNLMLTRDGQLKILDFGLTRLTSDASSLSDDGETAAAASATGEGVILGTPDYIAPEQINDSRSVDIRADIYSLGCTLFFALTGRPPFPEGTLIEKLHAHADRPLPRLDAFRDDAPPRLIEILDRMTAKNREDRYATPGEVAADLASLCEASPASRPVSSPAAVSDSGGSPLPQIDTGQGAGGASSVPRRAGQKSSPARPWIAAAIAGFGFVGLLAVVLVWGLGGRDNDPHENAHAADDGAPALPAPPEEPAVKLLLLLPSQGLWYEDYERLIDAVRQQRENGGANVQLIAAGLSEEPSELVQNSYPGVARRDIPIDRRLRAKEYDAIVFIGYETDEFTYGGAAAETTQRLLEEFQREGKVIAALCAGQRALAQNGILRGKRVAACQYVDSSEITGVGGTVVEEDVVQDGLVISAARESYAPRLVEKILETVDR